MPGTELKCLLTSYRSHVVYHIKIFVGFGFQMLGSSVFLLSGLIAGIYHSQMALNAHRRTCEGTKTCLESRMKLECEREQQEQLLLSVIPAYIAAEVRINLSIYIQ